jgi:hypothetical protein
MATNRLRAVTPDEKPAQKRPPKNVTEAAKGGDHRELLVAMRDRIASAVANPECPPRDLASLTKRLQDIARDIASIDAQKADEAAGEGGDIDNSFDASAI